MLHVLYLVHDVSDPAVRRRIIMLKAGGARVTLAGFRRTTSPIADVEGLQPIDLGATRDGQFGQRLAAVATAVVSIGSKLATMSRPDLIIARNLEMLALARRARSAFQATVPIVYECLDIHRLVLRDDYLGKAMRRAERYLGRDVKLLVTSSPAFIANYFKPFGQIAAPVELVENKYFETAPRFRGRSIEGGRSRRSALADRLVRRAALPPVAGASCRIFAPARRTLRNHAQGPSGTVRISGFPRLCRIRAMALVSWTVPEP